MINWDELKHIHVIRKLQAVLSQWFDTDILFVDDQGRVRNFDALDRDTRLRNGLCLSLIGREKGREVFFKSVADVGARKLGASQPERVITGPLGVERAFVAPIVVEGLELGLVYAYAFIENEPAAGDKDTLKAKAVELGLDVVQTSEAFTRMRVMSEKDRRYFYELVDLVAQEIVVFHTEISKREERINALNSQLGERYRYDAMIGKSKPMQELYALLDKIKTSEATVLVQGENGTGKELIARSIHFNSSRKDAPFVTVNCSAFNENLLDSELFGHVRGSFTGAVRDKKGLFEAANRGTLFLDEIGDMSPTMQVKLLRVLQEGTLIPVGGTDQRKVDVRVIAATNRDLKGMIEEGLFREDLYYRINVINITVPPLRDRKEDIPVLLDSFFVRGCKEKNVPVKQVAKRAMERLLDYPWPGNVRELENEVERLIVLTGNDDRVPAELLSARIRDSGGSGKLQGVRVTGKLKDALEELEKTMIREGLRRTKFNKSRLAKELGISRAGLIMKVEKYGLDQRTQKRDRVA